MTSVHRAALLAFVAMLACPRERSPAPEDLLIPESADIAQALEHPRDPFRDPVPGPAAAVEAVKVGYLLFTQTPNLGRPLTTAGLACGNCHLNAGQRLGALPLVGAAGAYPAANARAGRPITLEERVLGCLLRSTNAAGGAIPPGRVAHENGGEATYPSPGAPEVRAIAAYIRWLSRGVEATPWRGREVIAREARLPVAALDPARGARIYAERCTACHGQEGEGVALGQLRPGPLWGPRSWNDGAGFARTYTLAAFLRTAMPYSAPGKLTDEEAQHVAAFITSQPRPRFSEKGRDYPGGAPPEDAPYYRLAAP